VRDRRLDFGDTEIVVVTFTRPRNLAGYRTRFVAPLTVVADESRASYRAFGFGRGPWWRVYGVRTLRRYGELLRRGDRLARPTEDTLQLGGDVVIDSHGRIALLRGGAGPADRPPVDELVAAVARARDPAEP